MRGSSSLPARTRLFVRALIAAAVLILGLASSAQASNDPPFPITEPFTNTTAPGWTLGGSSALTAPGTDTAGNGWLRLTEATGNQAGYAFYDTAFPSSKGALVEFDYATYGGTTTGADGLSFFLYDGTTPANQFSIGAFGGSLGYAPCSSTNPARAGLNNAYIGVGFDEFGNFTNLQNTCGTAAPVAGAPSDNTARPNYVAVRGGEATNYPLLAGAATTQALVATRPNARHVTISVLPDGKLNVFIRYPDGTFQQIVNNAQLPAASATLKLGFAGSTGGSTNIHEIKNTKVVKPVDIRTTVTDGGTGKPRAAANTWTAVVTNVGTNDTNSGTFKATTTQSLTGVTWTCTPSAGSSCGAATSGTGLPDVNTGALLPNGTLTFAITGTPAAATDYAQLSVDAQPTGDTGDTTPNNNASSDSSDLTPIFDAQPTFTLASNGVATATTTNARGNNVTYVNQWQRCDPNGTNCANIASATNTTYTTTAADRGFTIRFTRTGTNAAGSTQSASAHYAPLPNTTITAQPNAATTATTASFSFTTVTSGATFECKLDAAAWAACTSPRNLTGLAVGSHTFQVRAVYGGLSDDTPASYTWIVDQTAPDTSITDQPAANASSTSASFDFTGTDGSGSGVASYECRIDAGTWGACTSPRNSTGLAQGNHTFDVRAIDAAGNTDATPASYTWRVDTVSPDTTITANPPAQTNATTGNFSFSGTDTGGSGVASYECRLDNGAWVACTSPRAYTGLAAGNHTVDVRAIDLAGNADATPASYSWNIDTTAPDTTITGQPIANTTSTSANFTFTGADTGGATVASYECRLDGSAWAACTSPRNYTGLAQGNHTFDVRAIDTAGNTDATPASYTWRVDTTAPDTTLSSSPPNATNATTGTFVFTGSDAGGSGVASYECMIDAGAWTACTSPQSYTGLTDGSHSVAIRAVDQAGNVDATPATRTWIVDTIAPDTSVTGGPPANTTSSTANFNFASTDPGGSGGATYQCRQDGGAWTACAASWVYMNVPEGPHTLDVRATDAAGNTDASPATYSWRVDQTAPDTLITSQPPSASGLTTASLSFTGTDAGSGVASYECQLDSGAWTACTSPRALTGLTQGSHTFRVRAIDTAGNVDATPAAYTWTVDTAEPTTSFTSTPPANSSSTTGGFAFTGTDTGGTGVASYECRLDAGAWVACTVPTSYTGLADGNHTVEVRSVDNAGNKDSTPASYTWRVDTGNPDSSITSGPTTVTSSTSASFTFAGADGSGSGVASYECQLDSGAWAACTVPATRTGLADGPHTFRVRSIDAAGNVDPTPATYSWTVDTAAPTTTLTGTPPVNPGTGDATFTFTGADPGGSGVSRFECRLDGGAWATCTSPRSFTGLPDGSHTFEVRAVDGAGTPDATPASYTWSVDTGAPDTQITSAPDEASASTSATFAFTGTDGGGVASYECQLDSGAWVACTSPRAITGLADGDHTFLVRAIDGAGNVDPSPATYTWTVDTTAPTTALGTTPPAKSDSADASFTFTGSDPGGSGVTRFECRLDGGTWTTCTAPKDFTGLADGDHTFEVRAVDAAGTPDGSPQSYTWTVDTTAPDTTITSNPAAATTSPDATFAFTGSDGSGTGVASFECQLDSGAWTACTSPRALTGLGDGSHTFRVRAIDQAGNVDATPAAYTWTVDSGAPTTTLQTTPPANAPSGNASFTFTGADGGSGVASFECRLDGGAWNPCVSPKDFTGLADGSHTFEVRAIDAAGTVDPSPESYTWRVDTAAPDTTITVQPPAASNSATAVFGFLGNDGSGSGAASYECQLDSGAWTPCSAPRTLTGLADGSHTFRVRAIDGAGTVDATPATYTWTVDTAAPNTTLQTTPPASSGSPNATFTFTGTDPGGAGPITYECRLDGGAWTACTSPRALTGLADGNHTFEVRAKDAAGNPDGSPETYSWRIDTGGPTATPVPPSKPTADRRPELTFTTEPGATLEIKIDGVIVGTTTAGPDGKATFTPPADLTDGTHEIVVVGIDDLGNRGPASTPVPLKVAATPPPAPSIPTTPAPVSSDGSPSFTVGGDGGENSTFECRLDGGEWVPCPSNVSFPNLPDGTHKLEVREINEAGVPGSEREYTWTVDTTKPELPVYVKTPPITTTENGARFDLRTEPGTKLRCSIDGGAFVDCSKGVDLTGLSEGSHTIRAIATDEAGNESAVATYEWQVGQSTSVASTATLTARLATKTIIHANKRMTIICRLSKGQTVKTCEGKAYARLKGKLVLVATGKRAIAKSSTANAGVRVKLNKAGMAALRRNPGGLKVSLKMVSLTHQGRTLTTRVNTKIYPARKTAHITISPVDSAAAFGPSGNQRARIKKIAKNIGGAKSVLCVGHTDKNGTTAQGLAIAKAACAELGKLGLDTKFQTQSKGSTAPVATNQTDAGRAKNRRVKLLVRFP